MRSTPTYKIYIEYSWACGSDNLNTQTLNFYSGGADVGKPELNRT